ncbi:MAG: FecR domain-containing protein [Chitinophagaceae bacterium]|nr:FecR domain-containing protein [Chitinophagaceae bacterium]
MEKNNRLKSLLNAYLEGTLSESEKDELIRICNEHNRTDVENILREAWDNRSWDEQVFSTEESDKIFENIIGTKRQPAVIPIFQRTWFRMVSAAVLMVAVAGIIFMNKQEPDVDSTVAQSTQAISPGGNKAILTLGDGSTIILDSASNSTLASQAGVQVMKLENGKLAYNFSGNTNEEMVYNTVSTPRGGQYQLTLADGSKVWLNAASSLHFPAAFTGNERKVTLTGEAYFEVSHDAAKPFMVTLPNKETVKVLGTSFNINSYEDEDKSRTTLIEGSVSVALPDGNNVLLKPGQQAAANDRLEIRNDIDIEEITAWKTGWFQFDHAGIQQIMRQVSRWYDVDVQYMGKISNKTFSGIVSRDNDISEVLKIMQTAGVKFKIEGKTIMVME